MTRYVAPTGLRDAIHSSYSLEALQDFDNRMIRQAEIDDKMSVIMEQLMAASSAFDRQEELEERKADIVEGVGDAFSAVLPNAVVMGRDALTAPLPLERLQDIADQAAQTSLTELTSMARGAAFNVGAEETFNTLVANGAVEEPQLIELIKELDDMDWVGPQGPDTDSIRELRQLASEAENTDELRVFQEQLKDEETGFKAIADVELESLKAALGDYRFRAATQRGDANAARYRYSRGQNMLLTFLRTPPDLVVTATEWVDIGMAHLFEFALNPDIWEGTGLSEEEIERYRVLKGGTDILRAALYTMIPEDDARAQDFATDLARASGSLVTFYATAAAGIPVWATGAAVQGTTQYNDARAHHAIAGQKFVAFLLGTGLGTSEAIPISRMFNRMRVDYGTDRFTALLVNTTAGSMEEFLQEFGQAMGEDSVAKYGLLGFTKAYDADRSMQFSDWLYQGGLGAITGAVPGAVVTMITPAEAFAVPDQSKFDAQVAEAMAEIDRIIHDAEIAAGVPEAIEPPPPPGVKYTEADIDRFAEANDFDGMVAASIQQVAVALAEGDADVVRHAEERVRANLSRVQNQAKARADDPAANKLVNERTVIQGPEGLPDITIGPVTTDDHLKVLESLSDEEIAEAADWYDNVFNVFEERFGDPALGKVFAVAWLLSQQNTSVEGGMRNVLLQAEQYAKGIPVEEMKSGGLPGATEAIRSVLFGEDVTKGAGAKISDFWDSAEARNARTWTGGQEEGGAPFVVDVHSARSLGSVDPVLLRHLERLGYDVPADLKFDTSAKTKSGELGAGSIPAGKYEDIAARGRKITSELNDRKWKERSDWEPREIQAIGWMAMLKLTRSTTADTNTAFDRNRFDVMFEAVGGEGSASDRIFGERYAALDAEQQAYVTRQVTDLAWRLAHERVPAAAVTPAFHGVGAWEMHRNASTIGGVFASNWEQAQQTAIALGWMLGQTEVMATKIKPLTASAKPTAISLEMFGTRDTTRSELDAAFAALAEAEPEIKGYTTVLRNDGTEAIRIIVAAPGAKAAEQRKLVKRVRDFMALPETSELIDGLVTDASVEINDAETFSAVNIWDSADASERTAYATEYRKIAGRDIFSDFRGAERQIRAETALAIRAAETGNTREDSESRAETLAEYSGLQPFAQPDGRLTLTHWSDEAHEVLDPAKAGTGPLRGSRRSAGNKFLYFGLGTDQKGGYRKEELGPVRHTSTIDQGELYNVEDDMLGLFEITDASQTDEARWEEVIYFAGTLGYKGAWNPNHKSGPLAVVLEPVRPARVENDDTSEVLVNSDFEASAGQSAGFTGEQIAVADRIDPQEKEAGASVVVWKPEHFQAIGLGEETIADIAEAQRQFLEETAPEALAALDADLKEQARKVAAVIVSSRDRLQASKKAFGSVKADIDLQVLQMSLFGQALSVGARDEKIAAALYEGEEGERLSKFMPADHGNVEGKGDIDPDYDAIAQWALARVITQDVFDGVAADFEATGFIDDEVLKHLEDQGPPPQTAGSSINRAPYIAEPVRDPEGVPETPEIADDAPMSLRNVANAFIRLMSLTTNQGRFTLKGRDIMGQYQRSQGTVRLRELDDVSTLFHEAGHSLHDKMDGPLRRVVSENKNEVLWAAEHLYPANMEGKDEGTRIREGFAELFRLFVENRAHVADVAPNWTGAMEDMLSREEPQLLEGLAQIGHMYQAYTAQSSVNAARSMVVPPQRRTMVSGLMDSIESRGFKATGGIMFREFIREGIDKHIPLRTLTARLLNRSEEQGQLVDLKTADDPAKLMQLARNNTGRAMMHMLHGVSDYQSFDKLSGGLQDALYLSQGVPDGRELRRIDAVRQHDFATYIATMRSLDEYKRFREHKIERPPVNLTEGDLIQTKKDLENTYGASFSGAAIMMNDYARALWTRQFKAGLISKEAYVAGNERTFYVPLLRDMSDRNDAVGLATGTLAKGAKNLLHTFRGSNRQIIDPMQALIHKTIALEAAIARNDVVKALARLADDAGVAGALVERVPAQDMDVTSVGVTDIVKKLTGSDSMSAEDASDLITILQPHMEQKEYLQFFKAIQTSTRGEPVTFYWDGGKLQAIQINDKEVASDVVDLFDSTGEQLKTAGMEVLSLTSNIFRAGITSWPDFILVNFIRDQLSAWIATDVGFIPFVSGAKGVSDELRQRKWARMYNEASGIMGGAGVAQFNAARVDNDISALRGKGYTALVFQPGLTGFMKGLARLTEFSETGSRLGVFQAGYNRAKADGMNDWEAGIEASFMATDYMDFGLHGDRTLIARRAVPFLSAQINGLYKFVRVLGNNEVARRKGLMFALKSFFKSTNGAPMTTAEQKATVTGRRAWIKMSVLGMLSAALSFAFRDDEDFQETSEYLRATGWVIPMGDGKIVYIPKPFEWAMVANIVERGLEEAYGDDRARERMLSGIVEQMMPPLSNPAWEAINEYRHNWDNFRGTEVLPSYMQAAASVDAQKAVTSYTSELAKDIGAVTGWKPIWVDHFIRNLGASAAQDTSMIYEQVANSQAGAPSISDLPILRRFFRDASRGATATTDMWRLISMRDGELVGAKNAYKIDLASGTPDAAAEFLSQLPDSTQAYVLLNEHFSASEKRLHPMRRAGDISRVVSAMRRELRSQLGLGASHTGDITQSVVLTAKQKTKIGEELQDYATREARNALIFLDEEGWAHRPPSDLTLSIAAIATISPTVATELQYRLRKARIYDGALVERLWPEARQRLLQRGGEAYLEDLSAMGKGSL